MIHWFLNYGCEIRSFAKSLDVEKNHLKFIQQILGVLRQTSNLAVYGELGRVPLNVLHKVKVLKYWFKILSMPLSLLYKIYNQQVTDVNTGVNSNIWASNLKRLLDDQLLQSWYADVNNPSKLSLSHIKQDF